MAAPGSPVGRANQVHPELRPPGTPTQTRQDRLNGEPIPPDPWKKAIYQTFDDPGYNKAAKFISIGMMLIIMVSTLAFILETELLIGGAFFDIREDAAVSIRPSRGQRACRASPPPPPSLPSPSLASPPAPSSHAATSLAAVIRPTAALAATPKDAATCTATAPQLSPRPNPVAPSHALQILCATRPSSSKLSSSA